MYVKYLIAGEGGPVSLSLQVHPSIQYMMAIVIL